jgi:hypothetical protein
MSANGVTGDWLPLGTLVRLPGFKELRCPRATAKPCTLMGSNLFLASTIGSTADFSNATDVPADFTGTQLVVPHPAQGVLYLKLRDDPGTVQSFTLPVTPMNSPPAQPLPTANTPPGPTQPPAAVAPASTPAADPDKPEPAGDPRATAPTDR